MYCRAQAGGYVFMMAALRCAALRGAAAAVNVNHNNPTSVNHESNTTMSYELFIDAV